MTSSREEGSKIFFTHILVGDRLNITSTKFQKFCGGGAGGWGNPPMKIKIAREDIGLMFIV